MLPARYRKRSFVRFRPPIDVARLKGEYESISDDAWRASYWGNIHCSIGMLLLRGGGSGTPEDFYSAHVQDQPVLSTLPYTGELIGDDGPFGKAEFAFLFRMEPNGVTLAHNDYQERWHDLYRIHVPIITNNRAYLIVDERSQHLAEGFAWTFDNQARHGVVNGQHTRVHLIFDVPFSERLARELDAADVLPGKKKGGHLDKINAKTRVRASYPGDVWVRDAIARLRSEGLSDARIAELFNAKRIPAAGYDVTRPRGLKAWEQTDIERLGV